MAKIIPSSSATASTSLENTQLRLGLKIQIKLNHTLVQKLDSETVRRKGLQSELKESQKNHEKLLTQSLYMQEHLRHMARQVLTVQEEERRQISRELHDEIAQTLSGINLRLTNLKREAVVNTKGLQGKIAHTQRLVEKSVKIVQRFSRELRPALLDDLGLVPALNSFFKGIMEQTHLMIKLVAFPDLDYLDVRKRTVFYRVAQETLTNVVRHANAKRVRVSFRKMRKSILMEIKDNGIAFNVKDVFFSKINKRLGLLGMRERVEMVGGTFKIESAPGQGTHISAEIPFAFDKIVRGAT